MVEGEGKDFEIHPKAIKLGQNLESPEKGVYLPVVPYPLFPGRLAI